MRLLMRTYKSGRCVKCLGIGGDDGEGDDVTQIISLEKSFQEDGGLTQYEIYGIGGKYEFKYRDLNLTEILKINVPVGIWVQNRRIEIDLYLEIENLKSSMIKKYRKEKLLKLKN